MYIITSKKDNALLHYGTELDHMDNGYPRLKNENVAFPTEMVNVHEVDTIPEEVKAGKYCYTPEQGFYLNPYWKEPNKYGLPEETVQAIQDDTIANLIELGVL